VEDSDLNIIITSKFADYQLVDPTLVGTNFGYRVQIDNSNPTEGTGMLLLNLRLPSCQSPIFEVMDALKEDGDIDLYEYDPIDNELYLYFDNVESMSSKKFAIDTIQEYYGDCQLRPHVMYRYYEDDVKYWKTAVIR